MKERIEQSPPWLCYITWQRWRDFWFLIRWLWTSQKDMTLGGAHLIRWDFLKRVNRSETLSSTGLEYTKLPQVLQLQGNEFCQEPVSLEEDPSPSQHLDCSFAKPGQRTQLRCAWMSDLEESWDNKYMLLKAAECVKICSIAIDR